MEKPIENNPNAWLNKYPSPQKTDNGLAGEDLDKKIEESNQAEKDSRGSYAGGRN